MSWYGCGPASKRALAREEQAKTKFLAAKEFLEEQGLPTTIGQKHVVQLLQPNLHLTSHCYGNFNRFVREHPGWSLKRREATKEEVRVAQAYTSKGKSYFIDAIYEVPDPVKEQKKKDAAEKREAAKKRKIEEALQEDLARKKKRRDFRFPFETLGEDWLQREILSYCDVPTLNSCIRCSKTVGEMAKLDEMWVPSLAFLLKKFVPKGNDLPLYHSSEFQPFADFYMDQLENEEMKKEDKYKWLFEDVSLREYYKQAATLARDEDNLRQESMEQSGRCFGCGNKMWTCRCSSADSAVGLLAGLPKLHLFRENGLW